VEQSGGIVTAGTAEGLKGLMLDITVRAHRILAVHASADVSLDPLDGIVGGAANLGFGVRAQPMVSARAQPHAGLSIGLNETVNAGFGFWGIDGGLKYFVSKHLAPAAGMQLQMPFQTSKTDVSPRVILRWWLGVSVHVG